MFVDKLLQVAREADVRAASLIFTGSGYIYLSNTIPLGNGSTKAVPVANSTWTVHVDSDLTATTPPCSVDFQIISGNTPTLLDDLLGGTYAIHYRSMFAVAMPVTAGSIPLQFVIDPGINVGSYKKYLGVFATFSGDGLSAGAWSIQAVMDAGFMPQIYPADALPN